jgi:hypothetical protein
VTEIDRYAFENCSGLSAISLPSGLRKIGARAFAECSAISAFTIPPEVEEIEGLAFDGCSALAAFSVAEGNAHFSSPGGVLFDNAQSELIRYPSARLGSYLVPDAVTRIREAAFEGCSALTGVILPAGLNWLERSTFEGCSSLAEVTLPPTLVGMADFAFKDCIAMKNIVFPSSIGSIGDHAFKGCTALQAAVFLGNSPDWPDDPAFEDVSPNFTIYYVVEFAFPFPGWEGYPAILIELKFAIPPISEILRTSTITRLILCPHVHVAGLEIPSGSILRDLGVE